jgi:IS5 family transposase
MRKIAHALFSIFWKPEEDQQLTIVNEYYDHYNQIDQLLQAMPGVLKLIHDDLATLSKATVKEREADFTSENLLRALVLMQCEGWTLRETTIRIADSLFFQNFCRLLKKKTIDYTLLCLAFNAIRPETWELVNQAFGLQMKHEGKIDTDNIRTDTTVTECNIHYPTDSSLLWDVYRVTERLVSRSRENGGVVTPIRFHLKKIKKLHLNVTRFANSKSKKRKRWVKNQLKTLIHRVGETVVKVKKISLELSLSLDPGVQGIGAELCRLLPTMERIVDVARRNSQGEEVVVTDKVFSLFEEHTELIKRGRREKPVEFGHKVLFSETKEKFITDYVVFEQSPSDTTLLPMVMERHEEIFGAKMKNLAADMGFRPEEGDFEELEEEVEYLAVPKRLRDFSDATLRMYQCFRAGIEGTISCLKRAYRLSRCHFHGFKGFCRSVGSAVFCHNLSSMVALARKEAGP